MTRSVTTLSSSSSSDADSLDIKLWLPSHTHDDEHETSTSTPRRSCTSGGKLHCDDAGSVACRSPVSEEDWEDTMTPSLGLPPLMSNRETLTLTDDDENIQGPHRFPGKSTKNFVNCFFQENTPLDSDIGSDFTAFGRYPRFPSEGMDDVSNVADKLQGLSVGDDEPTVSQCMSTTDRLYTVSIPDNNPASDEDDYLQIKLSPEGTARLRHGPQHNSWRDSRDKGPLVFGGWPEITPQLTTLRNSDGDTILHDAILRGLFTLIFYILNAIPSYETLNIQNNLLQTPLHLAVHTHQPDVVRMLVTRGARLDARDRHGNTPLHLACKLGCLECTQQLIKPVQFSETKNCLYLVPFQRIPQHHAIVNYDGDTSVHLAARSGNSRVLLRLLLSASAGHDVNIPQARTGRTVLHEAVERRDLDLLVDLAAHRMTWKLSVNYEAFDGLTPLKLASDTKQVDVVLMLLTIGATVKQDSL